MTTIPMPPEDQNDKASRRARQIGEGVPGCLLVDEKPLPILEGRQEIDEVPAGLVRRSTTATISSGKLTSEQGGIERLALGRGPRAVLFETRRPCSG